jgi:hypothetical protein
LTGVFLKWSIILVIYLTIPSAKGDIGVHPTLPSLRENQRNPSMDHPRNKISKNI